MISLRYYSCDDVMVCCGWDSSQSQYHLLINKNKTVLEDLELTKEQIDEIVKKASTKENKLLDPNARRRLDFDINTKTDVKSIKDGTVRSLSIKELMDRNFETVFR